MFCKLPQGMHHDFPTEFPQHLMLLGILSPPVFFSFSVADRAQFSIYCLLVHPETPLSNIRVPFVDGS